MAISVNKVTLLGNVGADPESKQYNDLYASFNLATTKSWKDKSGEWQEKVQWHTVKGWKWVAETIVKYIKKGSKVYVEGELEYSKTENEGVTKYYTSIIANNVIVLDPKEKSERTFQDPRGTKEPEQTIDTVDDEVPF